MNGDEVRRLVFQQYGGYDTAAVDELLDRIAAELDAGRPVAHLIEDARFPPQSGGLRRPGGYRYVAVDSALRELRRQDDQEARADPWRNLPAWPYSMASPDATAAGPAVPAGLARHGAAMPRAARIQAEKDYARECAEAWRDFGAHPGTQLSLVKTGAARWELRTADQYALVSARTVPAKAFNRDGRTYRLSAVKSAQWPAVAAEISDERPFFPAHLHRTGPDAPAGTRAAPPNGAAARKPLGLKSLADQTSPPVLYTRGRHIDQSAWSIIWFPGRRRLRFPVRGTSRSNAIMTAVDQEDRQLARYRIAGRRAIDITAHPDQRLTDELVLTLALTARWVSSFFDSSGGGG